MVLKFPKTLLWKVYHTDPKVCHYLFGTIHTATQEAMTFRSLAEASIDRVSIYAGEMNLDEVDEQKMRSYITLPDDTRISDLLPTRKYRRIKNIILKAYHIDLDKFDRFTPFYVSNLLAEIALPRTADKPLDHALWTYATMQGKKMHGLETFEEQCAIMQKIDLQYQIKAFKDSFRNIRNYQQKVINLNKLYAQAALNKLYKSSKNSMGGIRKLMIYDRNQLMIERCLKLFSQGSCVISVGAAHLPGDKGILAGLKRAGYRVKMVRSIDDFG